MDVREEAEEAYANSFAIYRLTLRDAMETLLLAQNVNVYGLANSIYARGEKRRGRWERIHG